MQPLIAHTRYLPWVFLGTSAAFLTFHNLYALLVYRHRDDLLGPQLDPQNGVRR